MCCVSDGRSTKLEAQVFEIDAATTDDPDEVVMQSCELLILTALQRRLTAHEEVMLPVEPIRMGTLLKAPIADPVTLSRAKKAIYSPILMITHCHSWTSRATCRR